MTNNRILVTSGSTRRESVHSLLARTVADELARRGRDHLLVSLGDHDMPIYHGDHEAEHGVPLTAHELATLLRESGGLLIASPEYNGAFSPLLKNSFDWVTRIDMGVLRDTFIGLMAASPGRGGGRRGSCRRIRSRDRRCHLGVGGCVSRRLRRVPHRPPARMRVATGL